MEHEGRLFGNFVALQDDVLRYNARLDNELLRVCIKPHQRMHFEDGKIMWVLVQNIEDAYKIAGMEFSQMMFDVSFPHECLTYCLSRLRAPQRKQRCTECGLIDQHKMSCSQQYSS